MPLRCPRDRLTPAGLEGEGRWDGETSSLKAPAICIQEKIDPRIIENLRETAKQGERERNSKLFETFDGLDEMENRRFLSAPGQLVEPHGSRRLAQRDGKPRRARSVAWQGPDDLRGPTVRHQVRLQLAADRTQPRCQDSNFGSVSREVPSKLKPSATPGELGIPLLQHLRDRLHCGEGPADRKWLDLRQIGGETRPSREGNPRRGLWKRNFAGQIAFSKTSSQSTTRIQSVFDVLLVYALRRLDEIPQPSNAQESPANGAPKRYTVSLLTGSS